MVKVKPSGFNPLLENSKLDDCEGNGKTLEKRKAESVCVQYCCSRKRMKDELLYLQEVSVFENCSTVTEEEYADRLDSVLNISNEDDVDCRLITEETIDDIRNSPLLDFYENATVMLFATPSIQSREEVKLSLFHGDRQDVCQAKADDALKSKSHLDSVQINEGKVICSLNTEDLEIPLNDDIFKQIHPSPAFRPGIAENSTDPLTSCSNEKDSQQGPSEEKDSTLSFTPSSEMDGPDLSSDLDSAHRHVGQTFKYESSDTKWLHPLDIVLGQDGVDTSAKYSEMSLRTEVGTLKMIDPESMANNPSLSQKNSDGDNDLRNFCDIDAMIFLLDLEYAQASWIISEETSALKVNVKQSGFNSSSTISRLDDMKGNEKNHQKMKGESIHVQYYPTRKRRKDDLFNSPDLHFFEKCNNYPDHVILNNKNQVIDAKFSDRLTKKLRSEETNFVDKGDSANFKNTEGDILCSLNTEDTMDDFLDSQLLDSPDNVLEDSLCNADAASLLVATPRIICHSESENPSFYDDQQGVCHWEPDVEVTSRSPLDSIQLSEGRFICILNTEDLEIPHNADIFLQTHPAPSLTPQITTDIIDQLFSVDDEGGEQELSAGKYPAPSFTDIIDQFTVKVAVKWKHGVDTSASYSEIPLQTEVGSLNNSISDHNNCYNDGDLPRLSDTKTLKHRMDIEYAEESYITGEVEMHQNIAHMVKVEPSGFNPLPAISRLDDLKRNKRVCEKRKMGGICIQYYRKRKRIKDDLFNSPDLCFFEKSNTSSTVTEGEYTDHPETIRSFATNDVVDRLTNDQTGSFDTSFKLKNDSANSSTVTEADILCRLNTVDKMDDRSDSRMPSSPENFLEDSLCSVNGTTLLVECDEESKDSSLMEKLFVKHLDSVLLCDEKVICNFNTEDAEIPCNDDIFLQIHQSSVRPQIASDYIDPFFSSADLHEFDSAQPHIGYMFRFDYHGSVNDYLSVSDHNNSNSDDDLPCFSDIDALIHRIDLEYAEESYISSEVRRHRYNYSQRTVTRLEQISLSSLQRDMSSLGALAVFYSRQYNYYIKKTEVTIGRSTKDTEVDIDLRKVGRANMISRRQATIKMETDGSFTLKNLGKSSISMNGDSVSHGQVAALGSSCVIEISGTKFMFEINERQVRRYLDTIIKESQGVSRTFEFSHVDEP